MSLVRELGYAFIHATKYLLCVVGNYSLGFWLFDSFITEIAGLLPWHDPLFLRVTDSLTDFCLRNIMRVEVNPLPCDKYFEQVHLIFCGWL